MSRPLRIEYAGAWYHIMHRGAGRRVIFRSSADRHFFLSLLAEIWEIWNIEIHAFSLMDNHYHLLIHTPDGHLSRAMRHLNGVYTQRFNKAHETDGPLFRGRFKSILLEKESYLLELVRYIHLNPVKSGLCKKPSEHRWTSHHNYLHPESKPKWLVIDEVLSQFGKRYANATKNFDHFVQAGIPDELSKKFSGHRLPSILGSPGFRDWIRYNYIEEVGSKDEIPEIRAMKRRKTTLEAILKFVINIYNVDKQEIITGGITKKNEPRSMAIYLMRHVACASYTEIAKSMGGVNNSAIAKSNKRFRQKLRGNDLLRKKVNSFTNNLLSLSLVQT